MRQSPWKIIGELLSKDNVYQSSISYKLLRCLFEECTALWLRNHEYLRWCHKITDQRFRYYGTRNPFFLKFQLVISVSNHVFEWCIFCTYIKGINVCLITRYYNLVKVRTLNFIILAILSFKQRHCFYLLFV